MHIADNKTVELDPESRDTCNYLCVYEYLYICIRNTQHGITKPGHLTHNKSRTEWESLKRGDC